jgi:hypothetical protein
MSRWVYMYPVYGISVPEHAYLPLLRGSCVVCGDR